MRARNIKPGFFLNCDLSEVDFASRLLFIGLWCYADREGRFEWKPKQIKASIFPYDNVNIEKLLSNLMSLHVIACNDGIGYIDNFKKHQNPHPHEAKSVLPEKPVINQCHDVSCNVTKCNADVMIPDTRIPDIRKEDKGASHDARLSDFNLFWDAFDFKQGKGGAEKSWLSIKGYSPELFQKIIQAAKREASRRSLIISSGGSPKWAQGWITERRWEDEPADLVPVRQFKTRKELEDEQAAETLRKASQSIKDMFK